MRSYIEDDIAAIATPLGNGAIAIIRVSGKNCFSKIQNCFRSKKSFLSYPSHHAILGEIYHNEDSIDQVVLIKYNGPNTYTGEDLVEINCHGGIYITRKVLETILKQDIRLAHPGEFTKRSYLNGKIDLSQAEAVSDLISSKSKMASQVALANLKGALSKRIGSIKESIMDTLANIDVLIDYPEYDYEDLKYDVLKEKVINMKREINDILSTYERGNVYKNGVKVAIVGKPNVGKSTFLNQFIGKDRSIVTHIPGTTRDTIEETVEIGGILFHMIDTAGIRESEDVVEKIGIEKSKQAMEEANIILLLIDAKEGITKEDREILRNENNKEIVIVVNKIDLLNESEIDRIENNFKHTHVVKSSLKNAIGIEAISNTILNVLDIESHIAKDKNFVLQNIRHKNILEKILETLEEIINELDNNIPLDLIEVYFKDSALLIGDILGVDIGKELVDKIFSNFCLGK